MDASRARPLGKLVGAAKFRSGRCGLDRKYQIAWDPKQIEFAAHTVFPALAQFFRSRMDSAHEMKTCPLANVASLSVVRGDARKSDDGKFHLGKVSKSLL